MAATPALAPILAHAATVETFVEAQGPSGVLKGTMLAPDAAPSAAKSPVALILPGSGPVDRDGNAGPGLKAASSRLLAEALAARGVATVRIDKRGLYASAAGGTDPNKVTIEDYAADTHAWIDAVRARTDAPCVWLIGHSQGSLIAEVAAQTPAGICGLVLVAGPGRPLGAVLREQIRANPDSAVYVDQAMGAIDKLEVGQAVDVSTYPAPLQVLFRPAVQGLLINEFSFDPQALLKTYPGPVLILQGTTDIQVSVADAKRLSVARPGLTLILVEGVNHVLKAAPLDRVANIATYADPSLPIAPEVPAAIADFIAAKR